MDEALLCKVLAIIAEIPPCQNSLQKFSNKTYECSVAQSDNAQGAEKTPFCDM